MRAAMRASSTGDNLPVLTRQVLTNIIQMGKTEDKKAAGNATGSAKGHDKEAGTPEAIRRTLVIVQVLTAPDGKLAVVYDKLTRYIGWVDLKDGEAFFEGRRVFKHVAAKVDSVKPHQRGQQIANTSASIW